MTFNLKQLLNSALQDNGLVCNEHQQAMLIKYLELLVKWNKTYNLTSITQPLEMVYLHLIDSLKIYSAIHGNHCLDVGSGAGLPGIPLAIFLPNTHWTLLDKNNKKTRFIQQVIAELQLKNVQVTQNRAEQFHPSQAFDTIVCRALGSIEMFIQSTAHLLSEDGVWLAMKGKFPDEELSYLTDKQLDVSIKALDIKGLIGERHIVLIKRQSP